MMTLYGSTTSPYVRRIRLALWQQDYDFQTMIIFDDEQRKDIAKINPVMRVPMLVDGDLTLFDSGVIAEHVYAQLDKPFLSLEQKNILGVINAATDSMVQVMILSRSGILDEQGGDYIRYQRERTQLSLAYLETLTAAGTFAEDNYLSISLFASLDWFAFRELVDFSEFTELTQFHAQYAQRESAVATCPRS